MQPETIITLACILFGAIGAMHAVGYLWYLIKGLEHRMGRKHTQRGLSPIVED